MRLAFHDESNYQTQSCHGHDTMTWTWHTMTKVIIRLRAAMEKTLWHALGIPWRKLLSDSELPWTGHYDMRLTFHDESYYQTQSCHEQDTMTCAWHSMTKVIIRLGAAIERTLRHALDIPWRKLLSDSELPSTGHYDMRLAFHDESNYQTQSCHRQDTMTCAWHSMTKVIIRLRAAMDRTLRHAISIPRQK